MIINTPEFGALDVPQIEVNSMRAELADMVWGDVDPEDFQDHNLISDGAVVRAIRRIYGGGVVGFLRDGLLSDAEIRAMRVEAPAEQMAVA